MKSAHGATSNGSELDSLGERLRQRRKNLRLTLSEVAARSGITEGFLSQIERNRNTASIATLQKICTALEMAVGDLFSDQDTLTVHRHRNAQFREFGQRGRKVRITPTKNELLESFIGEFEPYGTTGDEPYAHGDSEELLVVISGRVEVRIGEETNLLGALDSIAYRSSSPHLVREIQGEPAVLLWVMSPPSY
ncbi:XRE family transcriptional regulator [Leucobacter allii]|uniref:XRE family transcriptional regulator n=1 Tax=Leucobacter allii TaxID=2932247 RepID=A0ABY4FLM3_9MICO|nr:XRE family transcriptional regulator [Leucobacter allii]UOQ57176.1 XRE family transcriptional regulator [Leucobacter allii]UOR01679.1 XRE family transcriptional regulator [Leucobacter allii]